MSKKLINSVESVVPDAVKGLLFSNPQLAQIKDTNALVHANIFALRDQQVTVVSGKISPSIIA